MQTCSATAKQPGTPKKPSRTCTATSTTADVLKLVEQTGHTAYDCEYVALAQALGVALVTGDKRLPELFPGTAVLLEDFVS